MNHKNRSKYQIFIFMTVVIAIVPFSMWPYMWEGEFLSKWSSIVAIISPIGAPITYFTRQHEKERERERIENMEKERTAKNLYGELASTLYAIRGDECPKI